MLFVIGLSGTYEWIERGAGSSEFLLGPDEERLWLA
jgi:hypothetical protein